MPVPEKFQHLKVLVGEFNSLFCGYCTCNILVPLLPVEEVSFVCYFQVYTC
jgi:hypothetical protein